MINHPVGCGERSEPHRCLDITATLVRFPALTTPYVLLFALALLFTATARAEINVTDDAGITLKLAAPAQRIISLSPHITELLYAAGAGDRLIAAVDYSDYPEAARALPRIGDATRIDLERLLMLNPDLIIAWGSGTPARELDGVRRLGLPLYLSEPRRLDNIGDQLRRFGQLAGTEAAAASAALNYESQLAALRARYADKARVPVFYQLSQEPLLSVNGQHIISDVLTLCGAQNLFAELPALTPHLGVEAVIAAQPAAVIFALYPGESAANVEAFWKGYGLADATRYIGIPADFIHRSTPRILEGVERICSGLNG